MIDFADPLNSRPSVFPRNALVGLSDQRFCYFKTIPGCDA